jgi:glycosyltransferase involved in cell wall biosynthesis
MQQLVTVGIPVYKRLDTLSLALRSVAAQHYDAIELVIADDGQNGEKLHTLIKQHYPKPYVLVQNPMNLGVAGNFNRLLNAASGKYFVLLCDDDELSPDMVSELANLLEANPQAALAIPRHELMDETRTVTWRSTVARPTIMRGDEFLSAWGKRHYELVSATVTHMARTELMRQRGGYPDFPRGVYSDDAIWVRLSLGQDVVLAQRGAFRWQVEWSSASHSANWRQLVTAVKQYLAFLDNDPVIREYAAAEPRRWARAKQYLVRASANYYCYLWASVMRGRLSRWEWLRAGFAVPFIPNYYRQVLTILLLPPAIQRVLRNLAAQVKRRLQSLLER